MPAIAASVDQQSMCDIISPYCCARWNVARPRHDGRYSPAAFKRRALLAAEWGSSGIGIGIEPCAVVGGQDHDRIGSVLREWHPALLPISASISIRESE